MSEILLEKPPQLEPQPDPKSGSTTAYLSAGEDTLVVVNKMLAEKGYVDWEAVPAHDHVLQLDLDMGTEMALAYIKEMVPLLSRRVGQGLQMAHYPSKSGKNTHVVFALPDPMPEMERMAWQAVMGSDRTREALNLIGIHNGVLNQVVLFQPKDKNGIIYENIRPTEFERRIKEEAE